MSLLSQSESHAFQSFLSSISSQNQDWIPQQQQQQQQQDVDIPQGKEALAKATKDLMSLDTDRWIGRDLIHHDLHFLPFKHNHNLLNTHHHQPVCTKRPIPPDPPSSNKRRRSSPQQQPPTPSFLYHPPQPVVPANGSSNHALTTSTSTPAHVAPTAPPHPSGKPTLLSPSQKKANHIQSEQKRRANIRRGYEKLCETVPALRDAIRDEEDPPDAPSDDRHPHAGPGAARARGKRGRGRGKDLGEKVDGRAGPRSENVVLGKTIDYITDLLSERDALLSRLRRAREALPRGHPALIVPCLNHGDSPLWEREWKGGEGKTGSGEEDDDDEDD